MIKIYFIIFLFLFINAINTYAKDILQINDNVIITNHIKKEIELISYTGHVKNELIEINAENNKFFVLIPLYYNKVVIDENKFDPSLLELKIDNKKYSRVIDDDFFEELEIKRFPYIKINFGEHTGFVMFQIDGEGSFSDIELIYKDKILIINNYLNHFNY